MFLNDINRPSAIFIEYIPGMRQLHLDTFGKERMEKFVQAIEAITAALVMHNDLKPRNFMIAPGDPERVVILDFDRARTFDQDTITDDQHEWLWEDVQIVRDLAWLLVGLGFPVSVMWTLTYIATVGARRCGGPLEPLLHLFLYLTHT